jgi:hypothetical protein
MSDYDNPPVTVAGGAGFSLAPSRCRRVLSQPRFAPHLLQTCPSVEAAGTALSLAFKSQSFVLSARVRAG